jgi:hypothetical protein
MPPAEFSGGRSPSAQGGIETRGRRFVAVMKKNTKLNPSTGGWAREISRGDEQKGPLRYPKPSVGCHTSQKRADYDFFKLCALTLVPHAPRFSRPPLLLAITAEPRPRHDAQSRIGDGTLAGFTHPERTVLDPNQSRFDCLQKVSVTLAQMDLEGCLGVLTRSIGRVPSMTLFSACGQQGSECGSYQLLALRQQQLLEPF